MLTQCSHCAAIYPVTAQQLSQSGGNARCGRCGEVFSALERLADKPPASGSIRPAFASETPPVLSDPDAEPDYSAVDTDTALVVSTQPSEEVPSFIAEQVVEEPDEMVTMPRGPARRRSGLWLSLSFLFALCLSAQVLYFERERFLNDPQWRTRMVNACAAIGLTCSLPLPEALDRIQLISRDIRPHPSVEDALIINATLQNKADFAQAYPAVIIRLSDLEGQVVGVRRFAPSEYVDETRPVTEGLAGGTLLPLVFEIVDPGDRAVAFEFTFARSDDDPASRSES